MSDNKIKPLREQIDAIDQQLLELLNSRARIAQQVGHVKAKTDAPVFRPEREAQVLRNVAERNPGPLLAADVQTIFREIMSACRALEKKVTVAFLGPFGTFSEQAVYQQSRKQDRRDVDMIITTTSAPPCTEDNREHERIDGEH